jgi:hypothetical protein
MLPPIIVSRLYSAELKSLVDQYYSEYDVIRVTNEDMYEVLMVELMYNLRCQMEKQVNTYTCLKDLYDDYTNACAHILRAEYYDTSLFPEFIVNRVMGIIMSDCTNTIFWGSDDLANRLKHWFKYMKKIGIFDMEHVDEILYEIISNPNEKHTIDFSDCDLHKLCKVLYGIPDYYNSLYPLLRFLILNKMESECNPDELYRKKMLYTKYGELPISTYLIFHFFMHGLPELDSILYGLDDNYEGDELDKMYLQRCRSNNYNNFVITDYRSDSDEYHSGMGSDFDVEEN